MKPSEAHRTLLADRLFADLSNEEQDRLEAEILASEDTAETLRALQATLRLMAERQRPEPPPDVFDGYYDRLAARLEREAAPPRRKDRAGREPSRARRLALRTSAAALLMVVGVGIGWLLFGEQTASDAPVAEQPVATSPREEPAPATPEEPVIQAASLDVRTDRYLNRSKVLLLGLVNLEPGQTDSVALGLPRKQAVARELVDESAALRGDLADADQAVLRDLVEDLEVILLQIANLEANQDLPAIELVQRGVDRRAILLKINLAEMQGSAAAPLSADRPTL
ncbi:MAG: hypothetical protein ACR2GR_02565 [Rhodothermales bacterium]